MCSKCLEKEKEIPLKIPMFKVFDMDAKPVIKNNNKVAIVVETLQDSEETTLQVNSLQLRIIANYLDRLEKKVK